MMARTRVRLGETTTLNWEEVDFCGGFMQVVRNLSSGRVTTPKIRVDLSAGLAEAY
jgi:hypothetical protein